MSDYYNKIELQMRFTLSDNNLEILDYQTYKSLRD